MKYTPSNTDSFYRSKVGTPLAMLRFYIHPFYTSIRT